MPAKRLFLLLAGLTVALAGAVIAPVVAWSVLALDLVVLALFLVDLGRARRVPLAAERSWPQMLAQGTPTEVVVEIVHPGGAQRGTLTVELREALHPNLVAEPLRQRLALPAGTRVAWRYGLTPRRRGAVLAGPLTARVRGPWGLAWSQRELLQAEPRRVFPQVRWDGRVGHLLALAQRHQLGTMPTRWQGAGSEPYALRDYQTGDPLNRIHWKATARHGRLVSREDTWERGSRLLILLDAGRAMTSEALAGEAVRRSKLDYAVAAALALTRVASARGDRVTLIAFADAVERVVRIAPGSRGVAHAYSRFYDLEARLTEPAFDVAAELALELETRSATVVLFTSVVDLAAAELLRGALLSLERRHRPLLVNLQDPQIQALATDPPATAAAAFGQVAAQGLLLGNRRLCRELRRGGVRVVETPADRLALETLEAYLAFFRSRRGGPVGVTSGPRAALLS